MFSEKMISQSNQRPNVYTDSQETVLKWQTVRGFKRFQYCFLIMSASCVEELNGSRITATVTAVQRKGTLIISITDYFVCHNNCIELTCKDRMSLSCTVCAPVSQRELLFERKLKPFATIFNVTIIVPLSQDV